ncbi:MAG TPA: UvrD-helicase domain-containing protein, partial [Gemmatimonadota bacterium]|nr:UvrD-helicase domain-containing protein [Gemmatimonadota bacterium]
MTDGRIAGGGGAGTTPEALPDREERRRITRDLGTSLLVEAGAGSGKTKALTDRMVAMIVSGVAEIGELVAITFTRKAAAELRERFQDALELRLSVARAEDDETATGRLDQALRNLDRCVIGTIHAFCARLLRERPLEVGLDPGFKEVHGPDEEELRRDFWHRHLERLARDDDPCLRELESLGLRPAQLRGGFEALCGNPDVRFPRPEAGAPDPASVRTSLEGLMDRAARLLPEREPERGWGKLQLRLRELRFQRHVSDGWDETAPFFEALSSLLESSWKVTQNRWGEDRASRAEAKALGEAFEAFQRDDGEARLALRGWYEHRYAPALEFCRRAADRFAAERREAGTLTFQDLLGLAAELLRESAPARRDLARRYRHLLVDEFQDTDPLQAEVVFLLTSSDEGETDWRRTVPRPGSLFVVGDPKQSIYRFRRADISVYQQVRRRFEALREEHGRGAAEVVRLTANFRSLSPVARFANRVFRDRFPTSASSVQAAFAPLEPQRGGDGGGRGVFWYDVSPDEGTSQGAVARADAEGIARWIEGRVESGERSPGDFLVLTYRKGHLHEYGMALEARNLAVEVTGAELLVERELRELLLVLRALIDPDDPVPTVAVLEGLFFGMDHESLVRHVVDQGKSLRYSPAPVDGGTPVDEALATLRRWWDEARREPADVFVGRLASRLGLLPWAASGELGETRAGMLHYALSEVRRVGVERDDTSLAVAVDALERALHNRDAEAPLEPGREDAVRVMNLHKAKGTEAAVVVLAHPTGSSTHAPEFHVARDGDGAATGWLRIRDPDVRGGRSLLAQPVGWEERAAAEREFSDAEDERLLYVAVTRARDELVVARCPETEDKSPWQPLYPHLEELAEPIDLEGPDRPARLRLEVEVGEILAGARRATERRERARRPGYEPVTVTEEAKDEAFRESLSRGGRGAAWGDLVHRGLEREFRRERRVRAEGGGREGAGPGGPDGLRERCRALVRARGSGEEDRDGEAVAADLAAAVGRVLEMPVVREALSAASVLLEAPFTVREEGGGGEAAPTLREGRIDLAFRSDDGWVLLDYKTDEAD